MVQNSCFSSSHCACIPIIRIKRKRSVKGSIPAVFTTNKQDLYVLIYLLWVCVHEYVRQRIPVYRSLLLPHEYSPLTSPQLSYKMISRSFHRSRFSLLEKILITGPQITGKWVSTVRRCPENNWLSFYCGRR